MDYLVLMLLRMWIKLTYPSDWGLSIKYFYLYNLVRLASPEVKLIKSDEMKFLNFAKPYLTICHFDWLKLIK